MTKTNITVILAFNTKAEYNRLPMMKQVLLLTDITKKFGGVTLTEHVGGYRMDNGINAVEYSYKFELFDVDPQQARDYFIKVGQQNSQESIIFNGEFIYM